MTVVREELRTRRPRHVPDGLHRNPTAFTGPVTAIATASGAWCPSLSPDGQRVAYICDRSGTPVVEVAPVEAAPVGVDRTGVDQTGLDQVGPADPGLAMTVSGPGQEAISVAWSPDGNWLAYLVSPAGSIRAELHAVRPDGTGRRLLAGGGSLETVLAGTWTARPGRFAFTVADGISGGAPAFVVDVDTGMLEPVAASMGLGFCVVTSVSADGHRMVVRSGPRNRRRLYLLTLGPDEQPVRLLERDFPRGGEVGEDGRFSADGSYVYLRTSAGRERTVLARVPLDRGVPGPMEVMAAKDDADLEGYAVRADGSAVLVFNAAGVSRMEIRDLESGECFPVELPGPVLPGWSIGSDRMILEVTGPTSPRSLYHCALTARAPESHELPTVSIPQRVPAMPVVSLPDCVVIPTLHSYRSIDGLPLQGWLYRPRNAHGPESTVVSLHGGPESEERPAFSLLTQSMVAAGLTVFAPNVRGSSGYGASFMAADDGPRREESFQDVLATAQFLVEQGWAASGSIGVQGWSYGGYLALTALARWPKLFAAGATHAGMSDLLSFFAETESWMAAASITEYGDPAADADLLRALSPLTHLHQVRSPTMLIHGECDTNVPVGESVRAHAALKAAGVPTELVLLPGEGHTIVGAARRSRLALAMCDWFVRWLAP